MKTQFERKDCNVTRFGKTGVLVQCGDFEVSIQFDDWGAVTILADKDLSIASIDQAGKQVNIRDISRLLEIESALRTIRGGLD